MAGSDYSDSLTVATADGTTQVITVILHGSDDATLITGTAIAELTASTPAPVSAPVGRRRVPYS